MLAEIFIKGILIGLLVSVPLGPIGVLCIQRTLNKGRMSGFVSGLGAAVADTIFAVIAGFGLTMPSSYIPFGGAGSHEKQNKRFLAAAEKINQIAKIIKERPENYFYKKSRIPLFIARIFYNFFMTKFKKDVKKHYVTDNCIFCKTCSKICPNQNIQMIEEQPSWGDNCEQCMACLQWCPAVAIHRRDVPKARHRYQNPGIEAIDLIKDIHGQAE